MNETKMRAPVQLATENLSRSPHYNAPQSIGILGVVMGVWIANVSTLVLIWGLCFLGHIGHERGIEQKVAERIQEIKKVPADALSDASLANQTQELSTLINLDGAARKSEYDPLWFVSVSP